MQWVDDGLVLHVKPFGEDSFIVTILTKQHGLHRGMSRHKKYMLGDRVHAHWSARLPEHLGTWRLELTKSYAAFVMANRLKLQCLIVLSEMLKNLLPERADYHDVFFSTMAFLETLADSPKSVLVRYVQWECTLLRHSGRTLDFRDIILASESDPLSFVSPKTGRVVPRSCGLPYQERLLLFPSFLLDSNPNYAEIPLQEISAGLALTEHFLLEDAPQALRTLRAGLIEQFLLTNRAG